MNLLKINKLNYFGDHYIFESPQFKNGLNIITGNNRAGKTTFSDLIYYALGGTVKQFNPKETEVHREIMTDTNNFVELFITINGVDYKIVRKLNSDESNIIIVLELKTNDTKSFYVNRTSEKYIFSDWILSKLNIPMLKLYQGSRDFVLGFTDIARLIYHNQLSDNHYIHKQPDGKSNFINDSLEIRKTIFEVLTSSASLDYYESINAMKVIEYKILGKENLLDAIYTSSIELNQDFGKINSKFIQNEIDTLFGELKALETRLEDYEQSIKVDYDEEILKVKDKIAKSQEKLNSQINEHDILSKELDDFYTLHKLQELEIKNIERILVSTEHMGMFTPDKCPICNNVVNRGSGICICGSTMEEETYQNFFYTKEDHNNILSTRKVAIKTTESAINYTKDMISSVKEEIKNYTQTIENQRKYLVELVSDTPNEKLLSLIKSVNKEILRANKEIETKKSLLQMLKRYEQEQNELKVLKENYSELLNENKIHEIKHNQKMLNVIKQFSELYEEFLRNTDQELHNAKIDSDYMPVINEGYYMNYASKVHRRFFFYLSLLKLALQQDIPFPKFLLIDTPQNFGIDSDALMLILNELVEFCQQFEEDNQFQIILTIKDDFIKHLDKKYISYNIDNKLLIPRL